MPDRNYCRFIVFTGTLLIWAIKWLIRPYVHFVQPIKYILGIAPNLIGAFLIPLGCNWLLYKIIDLNDIFTFRMFILVSFILLVINEFLQLIPFLGRTFDFGDIAASAIGLMVSFIFYNRVDFKKPVSYP